MRRWIMAGCLLASCSPAATRVHTRAEGRPLSAAPADSTPEEAEQVTAILRPAEPTTTTEAPTTTLAPERPTAASRSRPAPVSDCGGWLDLVASYDWPVDTACSLLWCESKGDPDAVNPWSGAAGLFQILGGPTDPAENVALAYDMWAHRGFQPWVCR